MRSDFPGRETCYEEEESVRGEEAPARRNSEERKVKRPFRHEE